MSDLALEDFVLGDRWIGQEEVVVTREEIEAFARQYDPQPFHIDAESARRSPIGVQCASGWQTCAWTMQLLTRTMGFLGIIGGTIRLSWPSPTLPGDRLHVELTVTGVRESASKPDRGIVTLSYDTLTQDRAVRQHTEASIIAWKRATLEAAAARA